jgi:hypothetical protein
MKFTWTYSLPDTPTFEHILVLSVFRYILFCNAYLFLQGTLVHQSASNLCTILLPEWAASTMTYQWGQQKIGL